MGDRSACVFVGLDPATAPRNAPLLVILGLDPRISQVRGPRWIAEILGSSPRMTPPDATDGRTL